MTNTSKFIFFVILPTLILSAIFLVFNWIILSVICFCLATDAILGLIRVVYNNKEFGFKLQQRKNKYIPFDPYTMIMLFGTIFYKEEKYLTPKSINHENIHLHQAKECGWFMFYILYSIDFLVNFIRELIIDKNKNLQTKIKTVWSKSYEINCFECEAKKYAYNGDYLNMRTNYNWITNFIVYE